MRVTFGDGMTRSGELIRQKAQFVPLVITTDCVKVAHESLGRADMPPVPVESFHIPDKESWELRDKYAEMGRNGAGAIAQQRLESREEESHRLCAWHFKKHPLTQEDFLAGGKPKEEPAPERPMGFFKKMASAFAFRKEKTPR